VHRPDERFRGALGPVNGDDQSPALLLFLSWVRSIVGTPLLVRSNRCTSSGSQVEILVDRGDPLAVDQNIGTARLPRISSTLRVEVAAHRQGHERLPRVHAVLGLVEHHGAGAVDDLVGDLLAAVGRQAVHI
jgi:hypothetical protein